MATVTEIPDLTLPCNCDGALCEGETFDCETCGQTVPICRGMADARPDDCDTCWGRKNPPTAIAA